MATQVKSARQLQFLCTINTINIISFQVWTMTSSPFTMRTHAEALPATRCPAAMTALGLPCRTWTHVCVVSSHPTSGTTRKKSWNSNRRQRWIHFVYICFFSSGVGNLNYLVLIVFFFGYCMVNYLLNVFYLFM